MSVPRALPSSARRALRPVVLVAAGVTTAAVLVGCGGQGSGEASSPSAESPASSSPASSSSSEPAQDPGTDLTPGLLPAEAFGPDAQVQQLTEQQLQSGAMSSMTPLDGAQITPPECASALQTAQPQLDEFDDVAGQVALTGTTATAQVLLSGGPDLALGDIADQVAACPEVQVTAPEIGTATVSLEVLPVPDLGDGSVGLSITTVAPGPDGRQLTVPALVAVVQDGDRTLTLFTTDPQGGALDEAAFTALLEEAVQTASDALD